MTKKYEIEEMEEEAKDILKSSEKGLNKDSIAAIISLNRAIDFNGAMINSLLSGAVWAEYQGDRNVKMMDLNLFEFRLTEIYPRKEEEIYTYQEQNKEPKKDKSISRSFENFEVKLSSLLCLQNFLGAGMTDNDAIELFNRYFPDAEIDLEDCNFVRQKSLQELDKEMEKELEEKSREIVDIMKRGRKK